MPTAFGNMMHQPPAPIQVPALYLYPLNDSFIPKHIHLPPAQHVKIGRQTNAKTAPGERNGFFDSKVLSRQHAEVWEEGGKIFIKDVKSSNGTFINSERLSSESVESEPFELKTDDIVEFGIDIVGEDNKTIVHHKVAARVVCVFTQDDAQAAARAEQHQNPPLGASSSIAQPGSSNGTAGFPFTANQVAPGARRPPMQQQGLAGIGGMGGNMRQPGKSGLTFDHILNRLQGELQKSRETGAELHSLTGAMNDIHETLGGNLPQPMSSYHPQFIPPVMPPQAPAPAESNPSPPSPAVADLQAQLQVTQRSLADHFEKIRVLESALLSQDAIKQEVGSLREMFEMERRELELVRSGRRRRDVDEEEHDFTQDDDDARSVSTVTPHELESVEEEDEEQLRAEEEEERRNRRDELRPRTPEPTGMGMYDEDHHAGSSRSLSPSRDRPLSPAAPSATEERLNELANRLESALELSRTLQAQHSTAQSTISMLEAKVTALEALVQSTQTQVHDQASETAAERTSLTSFVNEWKKNVEGQWTDVREEWSVERARLAKAHEEWEARMRVNDESLTSTVAKVDAGLANLKQHQRSLEPFNGNARSSGLVTPPSPRSLSSDSGSGSNKRSRRRRSPSRGRGRSHSPGSAKDDDSSSEGTSHLDDKASQASVATGGLPPHPSSRRRTWIAELDLEGGSLRKGAPYPITPDPSVRKSSTGSSMTMTTEEDASVSPVQAKHPVSAQRTPLNLTNAQMSTAVGVLIVGVAAAAVLWRAKND